MNKLIIGLLVAAAGTGIFFLLRNKKHSDPENKINKEWIIGQWKADAGKDSVFSSYKYDFLKEGTIIRSANDSVKADTLRYEWNKTNALTWKENDGDSAGKMYTILKLTTDSLQLQSADSAVILFTRIK